MTGGSLAEAGARPEAVPGGALPRCPACGYTLAASRGDRCPECGFGVAQTRLRGALATHAGWSALRRSSHAWTIAACCEIVVALVVVVLMMREFRAPPMVVAVLVPAGRIVGVVGGFSLVLALLFLAGALPHGTLRRGLVVAGVAVFVARVLFELAMLGLMPFLWRIGSQDQLLLLLMSAPCLGAALGVGCVASAARSGGLAEVPAVQAPRVAAPMACFLLLLVPWAVLLRLPVLSGAATLASLRPFLYSAGILLAAISARGLWRAVRAQVEVGRSHATAGAGVGGEVGVTHG